MKTENKNKRQIRKKLRLELIRVFDTQSNAAYHLEIDEGILSKIVNAVKDPTEDQIKRMVKSLSIPADELLVKEDRE